ncbi:MAG: HxsD-like protein [Candidatus Omnitrophota bacterium]
MLFIDFHKNLYPQSSILKAIKAFQGIAKFTIKQKNRYIRVGVYDYDNGYHKVIKQEFCNYVLASIKSP